MVFSSIVFLLYFLPFFLLAYYLCPNKFKNYLLLISSILFYSWGAPKFIFVILGTTILDFSLVRLMSKQQDERLRKLFMILSICLNLGLLFYFKYCNFFIENFNDLFAGGATESIPLLNVVLPIGISFYTFESLTYVVDVYRKEHAPLKNFLDYQLYIILFPKLIAGPIIRYKEIADQIHGRFDSFSYAMALKGFHRFAIGLSKKILLANTLGEYADKAFGMDLNLINGHVAWLGALCYTMQIYFDFSGYSDMAIGIGQMMGFRFPENFNNPYTSRSITEFWRRWHITLGAWMRNYLYIPLGGNRVSSKMRLYFNLWIVFVLSGFWHGASWAFIIWGVFHGTFLILERGWYGKFLEWSGKWLAFLITFLVINFGWVFFREKTASGGFRYIQAMFCFDRPFSEPAINMQVVYTFLLAALFFSFCTLAKPFQKVQERIYSDALSRSEAVTFTSVSMGLFTLCISLVTASGFNPFIYFRF
jgi:alginate O-acetyltransferase complex protein AlgI